MDEDFVTIKISNNPADLYIAQSFLESENIYCFIKGELINRIYPMTSNVYGGAELQVKTEDYKRAIYLLIEGGFAKKEDYEIPESEKELVSIYQKICSFFKRKK